MFLSYFYGPLIDQFTRVDEKRGTSSFLDNIYSIVTHTTSDIKMKTTFLKKADFNNKNKSIYKKNIRKS